jgi:hypothetical protein
MHNNSTSENAIDVRRRQQDQRIWDSMISEYGTTHRILLRAYLSGQRTFVGFA